MQLADAGVLLVPSQAGKVARKADVDIFLRQIVVVDEHLTDLVGGIGVLAFLGVVVLEQELPIAVLNNEFGVRLDLVHHAQNLGDLGVKRGLGAEEDLPIGIGRLIAVVQKLAVGPDLAVIGGNA